MRLRDHVEPCDFLYDFFELCTAQTLWLGLEHLASEVRADEQALAGIEFPEPKVAKEAVLLDALDRSACCIELIGCRFHWYAVTACNLVQLIGCLRYESDSTASASKPDAYMRIVLPEVLPWRDKVAAHLSRSYRKRPDNRDNRAEQLASMMPPLAFDCANGKFVAAGFVISCKSESSLETFRTWSLTEVHELLRARYFPNPVEIGVSAASPTKPRSLVGLFPQVYASWNRNSSSRPDVP